MIVWEDISGFAYKTRNNPVVSPDIHLKSWCDEIAEEHCDRYEYLKKKKIYLYDVNYDLKDNWPVYHCERWEIDLDGRKYILNDGSWYAVDTISLLQLMMPTLLFRSRLWCFRRMGY